MRRTVTKDLKDVVMIGAVAVMLQTKRSRTSNDIDVALVADMPRDDLIGLGYIPIKEKKDSWYSPRGIKVDIYREDVNGIPVSDIARTAIIFDANTNKEVRCASLEFLILAKYRSFNASTRPNDREDLKTIVERCIKKVDWDGLEAFCKDGLEYKEITKMLGNLKKLG